MSGNVNIIIEGIVCGDEESRITTRALGNYHILGGVHILKYVERAVKKDGESDNPDRNAKDMNEDSVNTIKISSGMVEMIKTGENSTHMVFDLTGPTESVYDTPYGSLYFKVKTKRIDIEEKEDQIILNMEYSLSHDNSHISDNRINISISEID